MSTPHPPRTTITAVAATATLLASLGLPAVAQNAASENNLQQVAVLFVGHGEPAAMADGDVPITFASGAEFGPHAESLGVPKELQSTEWAAAYDEIATAMTYIFRDINGNGTQHEISISPAGDVPPVLHL